MLLFILVLQTHLLLSLILSLHTLGLQLLVDLSRLKLRFLTMTLELLNNLNQFLEGIKI